MSHSLYGVRPVGTDLPSQAEAEAGTAKTPHVWSAERVKEAIAALGGAISNTSITAVTNIDLTGFASATYDNYEVWLSNGQPGNDNVILEMETSTDGGTSFDTGASDYTWAGSRIGEGGVETLGADADDTEIQLTQDGGVGNAANENINLKISVFGPEAAEFTAFAWAGMARSILTDAFQFVGSGDRQSAADVDALRFHWSAGDWVAQGNIQFLGIAQ